MAEPIISFGEWLRLRRKAVVLSREELAARAGVAAVTLRKIEADERRPSPQVAELLAAHLALADDERALFVRAARGMLAVAHLPPPIPGRPPAASREPAAAPGSPAALPSGTVTFLFTDIAGSTRLWEQQPQAMRAALARHDALVRGAIESHSGQVFKTVGDAVCAVFAAAPAALAAQRALQAEPWATLAGGAASGSQLRIAVRMALHTGTAELLGGEYAGYALSRVARILSAGHGGQVLLSDATQELVRNHLPPDVALRDLGAQRLKDLALPEQLFQLIAPDLPADFPPLASLEARRHNLPVQLTSFIGRTRELAEIAGLFGDARLLTLTGPGGTGKTRLALHLAASLLDTAADGVWLAELAPLADPALVPLAVAAALGVREEPGQPLVGTLTYHLRAKQLVLVLDNCEHLIAACAQLADALLRACPQLRILASSREALGITGEVAWRVPPLEFPKEEGSGMKREGGHDDNPDGESLQPLSFSRYPSIQLFAERAAAVQPGFALTEANAPVVAQICRRLDGIPLAIELAAARLRVLTVEQIATRLDDRFRLLSGGSRTALPRHQTLRALIDWSYDLLTPEEQRLFRALAVFAGGFSLEAADEVVSAESSGWGGGTANSTLETESSTLEALSALVTKSLVQVAEQGGAARYRMLETIRQYALERLAASGEADDTRRRHAAHFLALAEAAQPHLYGVELGVWMDRLETEQDNLRAALGWAFGGGDADLGIRLAVALGGATRPGSFWTIAAYWSEGLQWLEAALAQSSGLAPALRAMAHDLMTQFIWLNEGYSERRMAHYEAAQALYREAGDPASMAQVHWSDGWDACNSGDQVRARALWDESLALWRRLGDWARLARSLHFLGSCARDDGDLVRGTALLEQSLALAREIGSIVEISNNLNALGDVACIQDDYRRATALYWDSVVELQKTGERGRYNAIFILWPLRNLAWMALVRGDDGRALALLRDCVAWFRERGALSSLALIVHHLGALVHAHGDAAQGAALLQEALTLQQRLRQDLIVESLELCADVAVRQGQAAQAARLLGAVDGHVDFRNHAARPVYARTNAAARRARRRGLHRGVAGRAGADARSGGGRGAGVARRLGVGVLMPSHARSFLSPRTPRARRRRNGEASAMGVADASPFLCSILSVACPYSAASPTRRWVGRCCHSRSRPAAWAAVISCGRQPKRRWASASSDRPCWRASRSSAWSCFSFAGDASAPRGACASCGRAAAPLPYSPRCSASFFSPSMNVLAWPLVIVTRSMLCSRA